MPSVTIQQAACNALAEHLRTQLPDVTVDDRWPDPQRAMHLPTITILKSAPRQDIAIDMSNLGFSNVGTKRVAFQTQIAACEQLLQLDVWANNQIELDDILARLDTAFNLDAVSGEIIHGLNLTALDEDNWPLSYFDYYFESPEVADAPFTAMVDEWRATFRGHAWMMLTVKRETARQTVLEFKLQVNATDFVDTTIP